MRLRLHLKWYMFLLPAAILLPGQALAQGGGADENNLLYGKWELVPADSVFFEIEAPKSQTLTFEPHEDGIKSTMVWESQLGVENTVTWIANDDGSPSVLQGSERFDSVEFTSTGPRSAYAEFTHAGNVVGHAEREVSLSGMEMNVEVVMNGDVSSRATYEKVEDY